MRYCENRLISQIVSVINFAQFSKSETSNSINLIFRELLLNSNEQCQVSAKLHTRYTLNEVLLLDPIR